MVSWTTRPFTGPGPFGEAAGRVEGAWAGGGLPAPVQPAPEPGGGGVAAGEGAFDAPEALRERGGAARAGGRGPERLRERMGQGCCKVYAWAPDLQGCSGRGSQSRSRPRRSPRRVFAPHRRPGGGRGPPQTRAACRSCAASFGTPGVPTFILLRGAYKNLNGGGGVSSASLLAMRRGDWASGQSHAVGVACGPPWAWGQPGPACSIPPRSRAGGP